MSWIRRLAVPRFSPRSPGEWQRIGSTAQRPPFRLNGIELDGGLAVLSRRLIAERVGAPLLREVIVHRDALQTKMLASYKLVIANPPYGRMSVDKAPSVWRRIAHSGHINKYAVFTELCFRCTKPGGIIALVIPSSFRAGPLYDCMRRYIRSQGEVLVVGSVAGRESVFVDVEQDVSVLIVRKGQLHDASRLVSFPIIEANLQLHEPRLEQLPHDAGQAWPMPTREQDAVGGATLQDYGVKAKVGYFVWNRERDRMMASRGHRKNVYPLIWAKNVKVGELCVPAGKTGDKMDFVLFKEDSPSIVRGPAAVMQRTTNDKQPRRLIAAMVAPWVINIWGGFVSENHTIVLAAENAEQLQRAVTLLNTKAVDLRYRRVSGTAAVSEPENLSVRRQSVRVI